MAWVGVDVLYENASAALQRLPAGGGVAGVHDGEVVQELLAEPTVRHNRQGPCLVVVELDVAEIGARGDLSARVKSEGRDELSQLSQMINRMLAYLERVEDERRQDTHAARPPPVRG